MRGLTEALAAAGKAGAFIKRWLWPLVAGVLFVLAALQASRLRSRQETADKRYDEAVERAGDALTHDVRKAKARAEVAQEKARDAKQRAEARIESLADSVPDAADVLDRYRRNQRVREPADRP